eukprot:TRINITY_DN32899_c0_g1_i1.p1 TRINITY_DN32899_c0_g1~~TRINITY_DN32899_c0_g1_i1.p1  ORF type:complete len:372 (+),score=42.55 TRINITY_DN32899_c0_g1_i1:116-1231(+)
MIFFLGLVFLVAVTVSKADTDCIFPTPPRSCRDILDRYTQCNTGTDRPVPVSGLYVVTPNETGYTVYCDMVTDGGGWLIISEAQNPTPSDSSYVPPGSESHPLIQFTAASLRFNDWSEGAAGAWWPRPFSYPGTAPQALREHLAVADVAKQRVVIRCRARQRTPTYACSPAPTVPPPARATAADMPAPTSTGIVPTHLAAWWGWDPDAHRAYPITGAGTPELTGNFSGGGGGSASAVVSGEYAAFAEGNFAYAAAIGGSGAAFGGSGDGLGHVRVQYLNDGCCFGCCRNYPEPSTTLVELSASPAVSRRSALGRLQQQRESTSGGSDPTPTSAAFPDVLPAVATLPVTRVFLRYAGFAEDVEAFPQPLTLR